MLKKILSISVAVLLLGYLFFAVSFIGPKADEGKLCSELKINIQDTLDQHYLTSKDIEQMLKRANVLPVGKPIADVNTDVLKTALEENKLIKKALCYKTTGGTVKIAVYQRKPIMRIMSNKGNYYLDSEGEIMPVPDNFTAYVPLASGYIEPEFARQKLFPFALYLQKNKFWNSQIEQIHVTSNQDVEIVPRVGSHQIILGKIDDYRENLDKLKLFYDKGLNKIGWNKYSKINLKYKNQVVCTVNK